MYVTLSSDQFSPSQMPRFESRPAKRSVTLHLQRRSIRSGTHLFHEGDTAIYIYQIKSGVLRLTRVLENGRRQVIAFGLPGDFVGFPNGTRHHSDCDVIATCEVIAYRRHDLECSDENPEVHQRLLRAALQEISNMQDHFMMLARKSTIEKVASFLHVLAQRTGKPIGNYTTFSLPMSRADIADFLGLTIETVSRTFTLLRQNGTIALDNPQTVLVLDMQSLISASQTE